MKILIFLLVVAIGTAALVANNRAQQNPKSSQSSQLLFPMLVILAFLIAGGLLKDIAFSSIK